MTNKQTNSALIATLYRAFCPDVAMIVESVVTPRDYADVVRHTRLCKSCGHEANEVQMVLSRKLVD